MTTNILPILLMTGVLAGSLGAAEHRVVKEDNLYKLAKRHGVTVEAIVAANGIGDDGVIWIGQVLQIPEPAVLVAVPVEAKVLVAIPVEPEVAVAVPVEEEEEVPEVVKAMDDLRLQVLLDRAGFGPGTIDGMSGTFTKQAETLCRTWIPESLEATLPTTVPAVVPAHVGAYVDPELPGTGKRPDFKALTAEQRPMLYKSAVEFLAERYHCSEKLLAKLNPKVDFGKVEGGEAIVVPNVVPFDVERYVAADGEGQWSSLLGHGKEGRRIEISSEQHLLTLWEGDTMLRSFPVTLNKEKTPKGLAAVGEVVPGPVYYRKKTGLDLMAGPNSPVGVVWCRLGGGVGIHGTNDPDSIGRSVSSGCIRLANWDVVKLAGMLRKGVPVAIDAPVGGEQLASR